MSISFSQALNATHLGKWLLTRPPWRHSAVTSKFLKRKKMPPTKFHFHSDHTCGTVSSRTPIKRRLNNAIKVLRKVQAVNSKTQRGKFDWLKIISWCGGNDLILNSRADIVCIMSQPHNWWWQFWNIFFFSLRRFRELSRINKLEAIVEKRKSFVRFSTFSVSKRERKIRGERRSS